MGASYATGIYFTAQFTAQEHMTDMDAQEVLDHISSTGRSRLSLTPGHESLLYASTLKRCLR